jgi:hypothetical protein
MSIITGSQLSIHFTNILRENQNGDNRATHMTSSPMDQHHLCLSGCVGVVTDNLSCVDCPQLEKVLQQGDIGECAEPYMVFKESDAAKVRSFST